MTPHQCKYEDAVMEQVQTTARLEQKIDGLVDRVDRMEKRLFIGNGTPPLTEEVHEVKRICSGCLFPKIGAKLIIGSCTLAALLLLALAVEHSATFLKLIGAK